MGRVTRAVEHLSEEEIRERMRTANIPAFECLAIASVMNSVHAIFYAEEEGLKNS